MIPQVINDDIINEWKAETIENKYNHVTEKMLKIVVEELRYMTGSFRSAGPGVVFEGDLAKSDITASLSVKEAV